VLNAEINDEFSISFCIQPSAFRITVIDLTPRTPYRQRTGILFGAVMIGHLILISAQVQSKAGVPVLEGVTFGVFSRLQGGAAGFFRGIGGVWGNYVGLRGAKAENEKLKQEVAALEVRLQEQRALASRAERLQTLLDLRSSTTVPTIAAEVIAGNPNPGLMTVTVNRGSADGVQADMAVIAPKGVVGRVVGPVAAHAARVQLIIDRTAAVGAISERVRAGGMAVGVDGDPPLGMELVSNLADIIAGDLIVASGVDGIYPKGFTIGTVEKSERGPSLHRIIAVRPAVDFSALEDVLIVLVPARSAVIDSREPTQEKK
jgi:rod shape-determining protein MreC